MSLDAALQKIWYGPPSVTSALLLPFSWLFAAISGLRHWAFRAGVLPAIRVSRPVIVVGNISVGGTGKTPVVIWLANELARQGRRVGIVTRGYGGVARTWPQRVLADSDPSKTGDEAVLLAQQTGVIVVAGPDRVAAAQQAIAAGAEVIVADDGLQHYRLQRDCELAVIDGRRLFGNGRLLPAGPLREPPARLARAALVLVNRRGRADAALPFDALPFEVGLTALRNLATGETRELETLRSSPVHVVTGIGHPDAFIDALHMAGLTVDARILPDHAHLSRADIDFGDELPVLMTAKDAVKCRGFADARHWAVDAEVRLDPGTRQRLLACIARLRHPNE